MTYTLPGQTGDWEIVLGLEVHAQIASTAKLFSPSSTMFTSSLCPSVFAPFMTCSPVSLAWGQDPHRLAQARLRSDGGGGGG